MDAVCRNPADNRELMKVWFAHPTYDDYWKAEDCSLHFDRTDVPCFTLGSWYDFMCLGSIESWIGRRTSAGRIRAASSNCSSGRGFTAGPNPTSSMK